MAKVTKWTIIFDDGETESLSGNDEKFSDRLHELLTEHGHIVVEKDGEPFSEHHINR